MLAPATPFLVAAAVGADHPSPSRSVRTVAVASSAGDEIDYVDVAQGDGVVMRIGGQFIVSDAGQHDPEAVENALQRLGAKNKTIDVAILSHPHSDHVKNFLKLIADGWRIKAAYKSNSEWWTMTTTNKALINVLTTEGAKPTDVVAGEKFDWGGADWEILSPPEDKFTKPGQAADSSVVYALKVDGDDFVFTGDIGKSVASAVAQRWSSEHLGSATVFLATHHGSANGSTNKLLDAIQPLWAVLSTGRNSYGHPSQMAIDRLKEHNVTIWCTNVNGTISARIASDGTITWVRSKQQEAWLVPGRKPNQEIGMCVGK